MFYAKLDADSKLERYPYTLTDLRRDNPQTSFPKTITEEIARAFNCVPVTQIAYADNYTKNYERSARNNAGTWEEQWIESNATTEEVTQRVTLKSNDVRNERNQKLTDCDWTQANDSPLKAESTWITYRQALRDVPTQAGFPHTVTWPTKPT
jgi:acyl carrier protein phosphodiesterase